MLVKQDGHANMRTGYSNRTKFRVKKKAPADCGGKNCSLLFSLYQGLHRPGVVNKRRSNRTETKERERIPTSVLQTGQIETAGVVGLMDSCDRYPNVSHMVNKKGFFGIQRKMPETLVHLLAVLFEHQECSLNAKENSVLVPLEEKLQTLRRLHPDTLTFVENAHRKPSPGNKNLSMTSMREVRVRDVTIHATHPRRCSCAELVQTRTRLESSGNSDDAEASPITKQLVPIDSRANGGRCWCVGRG